MFPNLRISTAQQFVFHAILSLIVGALASGLSAAGLAVSQPNVNLSIVVGAGVAAFSAWFVHGLVSLSKAPQFGQAEKDALAQVQSQVAQVASSHQNLVSDVRWLAQQVQQPMVPSAPVTRNEPQPIVMPQVPQVPFPANINATAQPALTRNFNTGMVPTVQQ